MELWIRSQDKSALCCVRNIRINGVDIMCYNGEVLGTYPTRQRALEVLDEIQDKLKYGIQATNSNQIIGTTTYVYEMPEK